jgi:hypothetical protein
MIEPSLLSKDRTPIKLKRLAFLRIARLNDFLEKFDQESVEEAKSLGADILVFCDRPWMGETTKFPRSDRLQIALLSFNSFDDWFSKIEKYRRNEVRKSAKEGVELRPLVEPSLSEAQQILDLYRESPFREGRYFVGYHSWNLRRVMEKFRTNDSLATSIALYDGTIVGVAKSKFKGEVAVLDSILSRLSIRRRVRGVATSLLASQVQMLSSRGVKHVEYGKLGVGLHSLDHFKTSNGFRSVPIDYNYLLLTRRARLCAKFGLYQPQDIIFSTKLRFVLPLLSSLQPHFPVKLIQKFHLYA